MPVRVNKNRDVITIKIEEETFRCRWLNPKEFWSIFNKHARLVELPPEQKTEDQATSFTVENRFGFAYEMAESAVIGWSGVKDENGDDVKFEKSLISALDVNTAAEISTRYVEIWNGKEEKRSSEEKNSKPTSSA